MQIYSGDGLKFRYRGNNSFFSISVFQSTASTAVVSAAVPDFLVTGSVCFVVHINVFKKPITVHSRKGVKGRKPTRTAQNERAV